MYSMMRFGNKPNNLALKRRAMSHNDFNFNEFSQASTINIANLGLVRTVNIVPFDMFQKA